MQRSDQLDNCSVNQSGNCRQQNPFLPPFLMGNSSYSMPLSPTSKSWCQTTSPGRSLPNRGSSNQNSADVRNFSRNETPTKVGQSKSPGYKSRAPPVKSLFESSPLSSGTLPFGQESDNSHLLYGGESRQCREDLDVSTTCGGGFDFGPRDKLKRVKSLTQLSSAHDSFYMQGAFDPYCKDECVDETWVTVFGFPANMNSYLIQEFSSLGSVVKHLIPSEGNWLHIQYQNKYQAQKALSKHGKVLLGNVMIGVKPCSDKSVIETNKENADSKMKSVSAVSRGNSADRSLCMPSLSSSLRPLSAKNENLELNPVTVQRRRSVVSNAIGYIFGW